MVTQVGPAESSNMAEIEGRTESPICLKGITNYIEQMERQSADLEKRSRELISEAESGGYARLYTEAEEMSKKAKKDLTEVRETNELCEKNMYPGRQKEESLAAIGKSLEALKHSLEMLDEVKRILESD